MKRFLLLMLLHGLTATMLLAQHQESAVDSGRLLVFSEGKQVGTEEFSILTGNASESTNALMVSGQPVNFKTRTTYQGRHPSGFMLEQGANSKLQFAINGTEVKMTGLKEARP